MLIRTRVLVAAALLCVAAAVESQTFRSERLLLPISAGEIPGGYGSRWATELTCRNPSADLLAIFPLVQSGFSLFPMRTNVVPVAKGSAQAPGIFVWIQNLGGPPVECALRLYDVLRRAEWGVRLPVVRDAEFRRKVSLVAVPPSDALKRIAVRVYALPRDDGSPVPFTATIRGRDEKVLCMTTLLAVGYAQMPLFATVPMTASPTCELSRDYDSHQVEIEASDPRDRLWAFASVTSNSTNSVTVIVPDGL